MFTYVDQNWSNRIKMAPEGLSRRLALLEGKRPEMASASDALKRLNILLDQIAARQPPPTPEEQKEARRWLQDEFLPWIEVWRSERLLREQADG